jgi:hypothetical protein
VPYHLTSHRFFHRTRRAIGASIGLVNCGAI